MRLNIEHFKEEIKRFQSEAKKEVFTIFVLIFVGISSFYLGKLSVSVEKKGGGIQIKDSGLLQKKAPASTIKAVQEVKEGVVEEKGGAVGEEVVASKSGKKYHYPWCAGAKQIAEKNKITFKSIEDARAAGYTPASNCKGLK